MPLWSGRTGLDLAALGSDNFAIQQLHDVHGRSRRVDQAAQQRAWVRLQIRGCALEPSNHAGRSSAKRGQRPRPPGRGGGAAAVRGEGRLEEVEKTCDKTGLSERLETC